MAADLPRPLGLSLRRGDADDAGLIVDLFDDAIAWLVARGQPGQWGSEPFSTRPQGPARAADFAVGGGLWVAEYPGANPGEGPEPVGVLVVGRAPAHVEPIDAPELYIELLLTARRHAGRAIGSRLVELARREARAAGAEVVRVDCWAGAPSLVAWYERQGFTPTDRFQVRDFVGQVFSQPAADPPP